MPRDKDILGLEDLLLLFIGPNVDEESASDLKYPVHLSEGSDPQARRREVMDHGDGYDAVKDPISHWQLETIAEEGLVLALATDAQQVVAPISAYADYLAPVCAQVLAVAAAHIQVERARWQGLKVRLDARPGLVARVAKVRGYLLINLIDMPLLHVCRMLGSQVLRGNFSFFALIASNAVLKRRNLLLALRIAQARVPTSAGEAAQPQLSESQGDPTVTEPKQAIHLVKLPCRD